jgi:hypothetical protein
MVVAPNTNVVRSGVLVGFVTNLGRGWWSFGRKEFESEFGTTNNNYWSY